MSLICVGETRVEAAAAIGGAADKRAFFREACCAPDVADAAALLLSEPEAEAGVEADLLLAVDRFGVLPPPPLLPSPGVSESSRLLFATLLYVSSCFIPKA